MFESFRHSRSNGISILYAALVKYFTKRKIVVSIEKNSLYVNAYTKIARFLIFDA